MREENAAALELARRRNQMAVEADGDQGKAPANSPSLEAKGAKSEAKAATKPKRKAQRKYLNLGADLSLPALKADDPRVVRAKELRSLIQFHQERFLVFEQAPSTPYELYQRSLRSLDSSIAQKGSQSNEDDRTVDTQTDETAMVDQEMQFQDGQDDTHFENLLSALQSGCLVESSLEDYMGLASQATPPTTGDLSRFLRFSTPVRRLACHFVAQAGRNVAEALVLCRRWRRYC